MRWGGSVGRTVTRVIRVAVRAIRRFFFLDTHNNNLNLDYYATRPAIRSDSILLFPIFLPEFLFCSVGRCGSESSLRCVDGSRLPGSESAAAGDGNNNNDERVDRVFVAEEKKRWCGRPQTIPLGSSRAYSVAYIEFSS